MLIVCRSNRCAGKNVPASARIEAAARGSEPRAKYVSADWPLCDTCIELAEAVARRWGFS